MPDLEDYNYHLPPELVAQEPRPRRDSSRLLVLERATGEIRHQAFKDLPRWLKAGDAAVVNNTKVFPARLRGTKASGGRVELLLHHLPGGEEENLGKGGQGSQTPAPSPKPTPPTPYANFGKEVRGGVRAVATYRGRLKPGQVLNFGPQLRAEVLSLAEPGVAEVVFRSLNGNVAHAVLDRGEVPLPPYIRRGPEDSDRERYQTVFASRAGAVAAPTAGLHFTGEIMADLAGRGIIFAPITLHVGPGTFKPVKEADFTRHLMEPEYFELPEESASKLNEARARGGRILAVGSTSTRVLEHCLGPEGFAAQKGWCGLYIYPGYRFKAVDLLLTNFHLPKSTLLLLVCAFAGRELIMRSYEEAVKEKYRFYSYGDCMLIV